MKFSSKIIIVVLLLLAVFGFWKITRKKVDPRWIELRNLDVSKIKTLSNSQEDIRKLFENFQGKIFSNSDTAFQLISKPFLPTMEFFKFEKYVNALANEKRIIISSVTGAGSSTLIDRLAKFVALDQDHILGIRCAPQFDLIYHNKYIGENIDGSFREGELLKFWKKCLNHPEEKFIAIFDDFDKINPETLFGPYLWEKLSDSKQTVVINGKNIVIPENFYMVSTTLSGIGSRIKLHNEHFKRLGKRYFLSPSTIELALYVDGRKMKMLDKEKKGELEDSKRKELQALKSDENIFHFLYFFDRANEMIESDYSISYQLGQWNNLRKLYAPNDRGELIRVFINHLNAISADKKLTDENFSPIRYSIANKGLLLGSSAFSRGFTVFKDWGFLTEFVVAICFALATALLSIYLNSKRKRKITKFLSQSEQVYAGFDSREISSDDAIAKLNLLKREIEEFTKTNKISFPEAIFFYNSIREKVNTIEITKNINSNFLMLMDVFLEDNLLTKMEYEKLQTFLDKIETNIPIKDFLSMKDKVDKAWEEYGERSE